MAQQFHSDIAINGQMDFGSKQAYTLPAQGTRMRLLQIADHTLCRVYLETSENSYHQPIVLDIFYRAQYTTSKPQIVRSESYEFHTHSNDVIFTSDQAGTAGADSYIYAEKVAYSTGRPLNIRKIEVFDGTLTVLDGSTTDTNGGTDETIVSTFAEVNLGDNDYLRIGDGNDLQLVHDASNSHIINYVGDLKITNNANDKDIIFNCDDGSGGNTAYITLDGSAVKTFVSTQFGVGGSPGAQLDVNSGGTNTVAIFESTDDKAFIKIKDNDTDVHLIAKDNKFSIGESSSDYDNFKVDITSGNTDIAGTLQLNNTLTVGVDDTGHDVKFFGATSGRYMMWDESVDSLEFTDNVKVVLGTGNDFVFFHDGSNSNITNATGNITITNNADDGDIIFSTDDGSGNTATYLTLDGGSTQVKIDKETIFADSVKGMFGAGGDLQIYHDGSNSYLDNITGDLKIRNFADDEMIIFECDDGSGGVETYFQLEGASGGAAPFTVFPDQSVAAFGSGHDLRVYHSGSHSYIDHTGTGGFYIRTKNSGSIYLQDTNGQGLAQFTDGGGSFLYHNASLRLSTTSAGITVGGGLIVDDDGTIGSASDTDAISIDDSGVVTFSSRIKANVREFEVASGTDGDAKGDVVYFGSTTSMTAGAIYHYKSNGTWELVDADSASTCDGLLAVALGAASNTNGMLLRGMVTIANDPGAVGDVLYASTTAGQATATAPSGSGDIVRVIGYCVHATNGNIWFNPDGTFVEVA